MKLSPIDIKHQDFKQALNGYNKAQVNDFLERVSEMLEQKVEEVKSLRIELAERDQKIKDLEVSELELKKAAILAERIGKEAKAQAEREAELILREAKAKGEDMLKAASDKERDAANQIEDLLKEAEGKKEILLNETKVLQNEAKDEAALIKKKALEEAESLKEKSLHETEIHKRRTGRMIENLKRQVELELKGIRQETINDIEELREKGAVQLRALQDDIAGLDRMRHFFIEQFQTLLKEYKGRLEPFEKSIPSLLKTTGTLQGPHFDGQAEEKEARKDHQNESPQGISVSPKLLEEIERRLSQQIQAARNSFSDVESALPANELGNKEIGNDPDDIWIEDLADDQDDFRKT